jgi:hypothetical protein
LESFAEGARYRNPEHHLCTNPLLFLATEADREEKKAILATKTEMEAGAHRGIRLHRLPPRKQGGATQWQ